MLFQLHAAGFNVIYKQLFTHASKTVQVIVNLGPANVYTNLICAVFL